MALSIITDKFRIENAKKFVQSIKNRPYPSDFSDNTDYERVRSERLETNLDVIYMFIGKITSWYDEYNLPIGADSEETPVPDIQKTLRQESEIWSNALAAKKVDPNNVRHVIPRENWTSNTEYPYYKSHLSNISTYDDPTTPNFYVLDENEYRVYKCLFNNYGSVSTERPTMVGGNIGDARRISPEPFETSDGYIWKYMYTIDASESINFVTDDFIPVRKDTLNDDGAQNDNHSIDGAIHRIILTGKTSSTDSVAAPTNSENFTRVRVEGINSSTDISGNALTIDMSLTDNSNRIATTTDMDMVGYQVEHKITEGGVVNIEIGEIVASTFSENTLELTITRLDDHFLTDYPSADPRFIGFSIPTSADNEEWFISPLVNIGGEGQYASAMMRLEGETGFNVSDRKLYPEDAVTSAYAYDIVMNTVGSGYRNIYYRNDFDGQLNSYVVIEQGAALLGNPTGVTTEDNRYIPNFAEIVSATPIGGHSSDNISELYAYTIMINHTFSGDEAGSATISNDFRQIALIQNPLEQDETLADAAIYRQTIRLEFNGDISNIIDYDDEISNQSSVDGEKTVFGRVVKWEVKPEGPYTQVYLSSSDGFFDRTADDIYNLNNSHQLYLSYDMSTGTNGGFVSFTLSDRFIVSGSEGEYQKGLGSGEANTGLEFMTGDIMYMENRQPIIRVADQSENIKLIIEY